MKMFVLITLFCLIFPELIFGQEETLPDTKTGNTTTAIQSSQVKKTVKSTIRSWALDNQFSTIKPVLVDTSTMNFHNYTPIFQKSISNTYLGYFGAPNISNHFFDRINYSDYYFLTSFDAYRRTQRDVIYFNTTTPFSMLKYEQGGENEQLFTAFFTQNIDSATNFGFRFNALKNKGQYTFQEAKHKNLNLFISRNSKHYNGYASLITASNNVVENGGIQDSIIDLSSDPTSLSVNFTGSISPTIKTFSFFTSHEYLLGKINSLFKTDSLVEKSFLPLFGIQYSLEINDYKRNFLESAINQSFFDTSYFSVKANYTDSSSFRKVTQIVQIKALENGNRKFTFGKRIFLENEIVRAIHPIHFGERKYNYSNLFLGGEISNTTSRFMQWNALARFGVLGRNFGDAIVKGAINKPIILFRDTLMVSIEGWYQDISPDIFQEHWQDNHFKWENKFNKQHEVVFRASLSWNKINLYSGANYAVLSNYLYNGENALPSQFSGSFSVLSYWLNKEFSLGPLGWNNKFILQLASNNSVIHLPLLNYYTSIYLKGILFKVLKYQLGAEMYYNSKFYADKYEPSTSRFYLQNEILTGAYPQLNAFINAKLKRTTAFAQLMHFNSSFSNGKFFSSPFYPINQMAFRFGFLWSFYD